MGKGTPGRKCRPRPKPQDAKAFFQEGSQTPWLGLPDFGYSRGGIVVAEALDETDESARLIFREALFPCGHIGAEFGCGSAVADHVVGFRIGNPPHPITISEVAR